MKSYYVYIMTSHSRVLYTGITNDLDRRVMEHQHGRSYFTGRYRVNHLVYFERYDDVEAAMNREKQIKGLLRSKKIALIEKINPEWRDRLLDGETLPPDPSSLRSSG